MESETELEQGYEMPKEENMEFSEPEIDIEDVELEMPSHTIDCVSYNNLDVCVAVVDTESDEIDAEFAEAIAEIEGKESFPCPPLYENMQVKRRFDPTQIF